MPVRIGYFYAFLLMLLCVVVNIAFFAEVREPFLGDEDPTASIKSVFADWDIEATLAEYFPKVQSKVPSPVEEIPDELQPEPPKEEKRVPKEPSRKEPLQQEPVPKEEPPTPKVAPEALPASLEGAVQTAAALPVPQSAAIKPAVAEQFKPIIAPPSMPASSPVWMTVDTVLERPIKYDR